MISLSQLNKLIKFTIISLILIFNNNSVLAAVDIWEKKENEKKQENKSDNEKKITIESPILSDDTNKITIKINEQAIEDSENSVVGIFDPEENDFNLDMWTRSDGKDIKEILKRINKLKLSKLSEDLLFQVLFTNAYPPKNNLTSEEFLKIKINWLIKNKRLKDLEVLLKNNPDVGKQSKAIKFLINEYIASTDIKSACEKKDFISKDIQNDYLDKFTIYCLLNAGLEEEAQLYFDIAKERGMKDKFFENKINFLLGITDKTTEKILDDNLLNFYLSHITSSSFQYEPNDKTDKYIWRYLSSANLIQTTDFENEDVISTYEQAASTNSLNKDEVFKIYLRMPFNFNQLLNSTELYKNLPSYKARALIYQSILLTVDVEKKLYLTFLLKDLFKKDKLMNVYSEELSNILKDMDSDSIPESYSKLVEKNLDQSLQNIKKVKFNNDILHRSKIIRHFLDNYKQTSRTEKDFKSVYKKIKKNKKYFISIMDIIVLESLAADGVVLPGDLDYISLSSQLTVPQSLEDLAKQNQTGLVMLKIIEIIGEDKISDLDPETIYFLNKIFNDLNLKKIRNDILSAALPVRV